MCESTLLLSKKYLSLKTKLTNYAHLNRGSINLVDIGVN